jgi:hypothetical protein
MNRELKKVKAVQCSGERAGAKTTTSFNEGAIPKAFILIVIVLVAAVIIVFGIRLVRYHTKYKEPLPPRHYNFNNRWDETILFGPAIFIFELVQQYLIKECTLKNHLTGG